MVTYYLIQFILTALNKITLYVLVCLFIFLLTIAKGIEFLSFWGKHRLHAESTRLRALNWFIFFDHRVGHGVQVKRCVRIEPRQD
jgi:hypothetical protein